VGRNSFRPTPGLEKAERDSAPRIWHGWEGDFSSPLRRNLGRSQSNGGDLKSPPPRRSPEKPSLRFLQQSPEPLRQERLRLPPGGAGSFGPGRGLGVGEEDGEEL